MPHEIALFWLVVAAFLFFDNLIVVPQGCELLRFDRRGRLRYEATSRLTAASRELVLLNPLNLFDRGLLTTQCFGDVELRVWKQGRRLVRSAVPTLNTFSLLGYVYMLLVAGLAYISFQLGLLPALVVFVAVHLTLWVLCLGILVARRRQLHLSGYEVFSYATEAILVPAYLMNLGKRLANKQRVGISALGLGLRALKTVDDDDLRLLLKVRLRERLEVLEMTQGYENALADEGGVKVANTHSTHSEHDDVGCAPLSSTQKWIQEAKACLTI